MNQSNRPIFRLVTASVLAALSCAATLVRTVPSPTGGYMNLGDTVEFAAAANALKHSIHGDALIAGADEVLRLARSTDGTVRMLR